MRVQTASILDEIGRLLATHKVVPFLGAGISRSQLGFAAPGLRRLIAESLGEPHQEGTDLAAVAQRMSDKFGPKGLATELCNHLHRTEIDDILATTHLLVLSLDCGVVYTTNQDNLFELACLRYKRPYRTIITIDDIAGTEPGERLYIKFHGDPRVVASLVFTTDSYVERMDGPENFLDIRLRSDLLGKGLLFIGYSMQDENLRALMRQIQRAYLGKTPISYLIAYDYQPDMEQLTEEFGIQILDPKQLMSEFQNSAEAFERCLQTLCDATLGHKSKKALSDFFTAELPSPVLIEHQLKALEKVARTEDVVTALKAFRASADAAYIPDHLQRRVAEVVVVIAEKIVSPEEIDTLKHALFNLNLQAEHALLAMAAFMAACNVRVVTPGFDSSFLIASPCMPEEFWPVAAAYAIDMLIGGGYEISDGFRQSADGWFEDLGSLSEKNKFWVIQQIETAWAGSRRESPIARAARLGPIYKPFGKRLFRDISESITMSYPKKFNPPNRTL